ncbi:MAG: DnaD domain protein [Lachnospiraceae bacterium]|nr:DnaD domain protein [Lachnospiraceae bacterium]
MKELVLSTTISDSHLEIPVSFIDQYLTKASGLALKVYLYLVRASKDASIRFSINDLSVMFDETPNKILTALGYWAGQGLLVMEYDGEELSAITLTDGSESAPARQEKAVRKPERQEETAVIKPERKEALFGEVVVKKRSGSSAYDAAAEEAVEEILPLLMLYGSPKPSERMKKAFMDAFILLNRDHALLEFLVESLAEADTWTEKAIRDRAGQWAEAGVRDVSEAKGIVNPSSKEVRDVLRSLGIRNRMVAPSEEEIIRGWLKKFDTELVTEACTRTVNTIHDADFRYVTGILNRWEKAGVRTIADVGEEDEKHRRRTEKVKAPDQTIRTSFRNYQERNTDYEALFATGET